MPTLPATSQVPASRSKQEIQPLSLQQQRLQAEVYSSAQSPRIPQQQMAAGVQPKPEASQFASAQSWASTERPRSMGQAVVLPPRLQASSHAASLKAQAASQANGQFQQGAAHASIPPAHHASSFGVQTADVPKTDNSMAQMPAHVPLERADAHPLPSTAVPSAAAYTGKIWQWLTEETMSTFVQYRMGIPHVLFFTTRKQIPKRYEQVWCMCWPL